MTTQILCRQCEQTLGGTGCVQMGVCGKSSETAALQDLLIYGLRSLAVYGAAARDMGIKDAATDLLVAEALFTTITNVNFDPSRIAAVIREVYKAKEKMKQSVLDAYKRNNKVFDDKWPSLTRWVPADSLEGLVAQGRDEGALFRPGVNEDIRSLRELLLFGMKGMAAYADHASILGKTDESVNSFFYKGLVSLTDDAVAVDSLVALNMELGRVNLKCLEMLDMANTEKFGHPSPAKVDIGVKKGAAIIVSGHDLEDLEQLLEQTQGLGVNVYTHGEMLAAHGYPELRKYKNLVGHFGTAWQNQQREFDNLPAAILMTTNCIQKPRESYSDRIFTTGLVAWPGIQHINAASGKKDFAAVINKAKQLGGFTQENIARQILVGFAHNTILSLAPQIISAVKSGKIKRFFLIGGCDGSKPGRNYYTEFARQVPSDSIILTLACGKFKFNDLDLGYIGEFPRLLDCGQCNDAYSAIKVAGALAEAFGCGLNDLPLSLVLSWYEQKAVCILLTLLSLGIKNIRLGPSLPAFVSPNVLKVLVEKFNIKPISTPEKDLKEILA